MRLFSKSRAKTRHSTFFQVREAIDRDGCPVCRLSLGSVASYLDSLAYESVNDPNLRGRLRSSRGFCPRHAWQFLGVDSGPFSVAIIYADVLAEVTRVLEPGGHQRRPTRNSGESGLELASRLAPQQPCPACRLLAESRDRYLSTLVEHLPEHDFAAAYRSSQGLCLPHLEGAISQTSDIGIRQILLETALHTLEKAPASQGIAGGSAFLQPDEFLSGAEGSLMECRQRPMLWPGTQRNKRRTTVGGQIRRADGEGCPLCEEAEGTDDELNGRLPSVEAGNLCNLHLRRFLTKAQLRDVFRLVEGKRLGLIERLKEGAHQPAGKHGTLDKLLGVAHRWLSPTRRPYDEVCCGAGTRETQMQSGQAAAFAEAMTNPEFRDAFLKSPGLCFTHLLLALASASPEGVAVLAETEAMKFQGLVAELNEYVRKHDYRFSREPWGEESSSPWRAVRKMAGTEGAWGGGGLWAPGGTRL